MMATTGIRKTINAGGRDGLRRIAALVASCLLLLAAAGPAIAQDGDGGTQSPFSSIGAGSRAIGLGQAYVGLADDASAIYWNPATLRNVQRKQFMFMYMPVYGDFTGASYTYLGTVWPTLNAGSIGLGFMRIGTDFEGFDANSLPTGSQDYSESQFLIGYAFERSPGFLLGALASGLNFKIATQEIGSLSSVSPGIDLGFRYYPNFNPGFSLAVNFQDIVGPEHKLVSDADRTDMTIMAGAGYTHVFANGSAATFGLQLDMPERADNKFRFGGEYAFARYLALRLGYDSEGVTFGLGATVKGFGFDYAFLNRDTAGSSHPVSFSTGYGNTLFEQRQVLAEQRAAEEQRLIQEAFAGRVQQHRDLAQQAETAGDLSGALDEWKIVLEYVPGDDEATARMAAITQALVDEQSRQTQDIAKRATISAHFSQGLQFYQSNEYVRSREEWRAILAIDPDHTDAQEYLQKTQDKIDEQLTAHIRRAEQLEGSQRYTEAIGEWNNVQVLDPGNARATAAIARIQGKIESQSQDLQQVARRLNIVNLYNTALQEYNQGDYSKAIADLDQLLALEPGHEDAKKLHRLAKRKLTPLTDEEEAQIRRLYLRGMQFFSKDQYAEAIAEWQQILEIDPTNESVQRNIEEAKSRLEQLGNSR